MADEHARGIIMAPGDGQTVANPAGGGLTYKARSAQTGGALTAWESTAAPGEGPPLHLHANEDEFMYVLEGRLRFIVDETEHIGPAGSFVFIPRGIPHTWQNMGDGHARILFVFTPGSPGMERFVERSAAIPQDTRMADAFETLSSEAGMNVLGPPLARSASAS
jgi:quercetin dioxygenase-like cupin family protein